jgi:hypothetical protein
MNLPGLMTTPPPAQPDIPALLGVVNAWVAEHRNTISRAYLTAEPGVLNLFVHGRPGPWTFAEHSALLDPLSDLDISIANDGRFAGVVFRSDAPPPDHPTPDDAIALDDPDAAAKIADRIRTADDLRAELARVAGERDSLLESLVEPEMNQIWSDRYQSFGAIPTGRWFSHDVVDLTKWHNVFPTRAEAKADVLAQIRKISIDEVAAHE